MIYEKLNAEQIEKLFCIFDTVIEGNNLKSFKINLGDKTVHIKASDYGSSLEILTPKEDVIEDRYRISGTINGVEIAPKIFEIENYADSFMEKLDCPKKEIIKFNVTKDYYTGPNQCVEPVTPFPIFLGEKL